MTEIKPPRRCGAFYLAISISGIHFIGVGPGEVALVEPEFTLSDSTPLVPRLAEPLVFAPVVLDEAWSGVLAPGAPGVPPWAASSGVGLVFTPGTPVAPPWAPVAGFCCASAKALDSTKAVANPIVLSFMFVSFLKWRGEQIALPIYVPAPTLIHCPKNQPFAGVKLRAVVPYEGGRDKDTSQASVQ
jgi:hypothetical protein